MKNYIFCTSLLMCLTVVYDVMCYIVDRKRILKVFILNCHTCTSSQAPPHGLHANKSRFTELVRNDKENSHFTIHHALTTLKETWSNNVIVIDPDNSKQMDHKRRYTLASRRGEYSDEILLLVYKKEKSLEIKRDVGMACQKYTNKEQ